MDHLIQIPQVGRPSEAIPEPLVALGLLAGATTTLHLGTLVSPVTFRPAGLLAKALATLDALSGGRAFCGPGLPATAYYLRPVGALPIITGGARRRVLRIAGAPGDACNVPADRVGAVGEQKRVTVLDVPVLLIAALRPADRPSPAPPG